MQPPFLRLALPIPALSLQHQLSQLPEQQHLLCLGFLPTFHLDQTKWP
tara:strand:- start:225 stop:368 length:144 start_codon:yes stop_codon:yes gene_type:complete